MRPGDPAGNVRATEYYVKIDPASAGRRLLKWTPERTTGVVYHVILDGIEKYRTTELEQTIARGETNVRSVIEVIETSTQNEREFLYHVAGDTGNRVRCRWDPVAGATKYLLYRKESGGSYGAPIYETERVETSYEYMDGPLEDGTYVYKLVSEDDQGDSTFDEETAIVSTVPNAPTNIAGSWNPTTHVLTISWTASDSADIDHYAIRHNGGSGFVRLDDTPEDTEATTSWTIDLTGLTGDYEFLIRAVDADGNENADISQMIAISVVAGIAQGRPADPDAVKVEPIAGGKARLSFTYAPSKETGFVAGGVAKEARIFWDNGTGTMDWNTPLDTLLMDNPTALARWSWDSGVLTNGTYLFGVRIATDTGGGGTETQNTDEYEVTTNDDVPASTDLAVLVR